MIITLQSDPESIDDFVDWQSMCQDWTEAGPKMQDTDLREGRV